MMVSIVQHEQVRDAGDRSWTFALLEEVGSLSASEAERDEAVYTLISLEDYRAVGPLTAMVEDDRLRATVRRAAADVLTGLDDSTTGERRRGWWKSGDPVKMALALGLMERSEADIVVSVACDDGHPWQGQALARMIFGFDEAKFQPVTIRALMHPNADVRETAADVLLWNEPVAAEGPLLSAASDPCGDVAAAAVSTLQYYPSRRVLRALADLAEAQDDRVRAKAAESFDDLRGRFQYRATYGNAEQVTLLREWMKPVADLVLWPAEILDRELFSSPAHRSRIVMSYSELVAWLLDPDGEWAARKEALSEVAWERFTPGERGRLSEALTMHPDPAVRETATVPLTAWSRSEELLALICDPSFSVRKSAVFQLGLVPPDPALAVVAWDYMLGAADTTAYEALRTYVAHACADEAKERLSELARTDPRECIQTQAIVSLVGLGAAREVESLVSLLGEPPGVSWAVPIEVLDGHRTLGLPEPELHDLATVDNLDLMHSVVALRCSSRRSRGHTT